MRLRPLDPADVEADPKRRLLLSFVNALADLAHPKAALRTLGDAPRLAAFERGAAAALSARPGAHVLVLSSGGGVLPLLAARAGAGHVTAVERGRMLYRMAKQVLESNGEAKGAANVHLLDRGLRAVGVQGEAAPPEVARARGQQPAEEGEAQGARLPCRAQVLITDLFDHAALGCGLLPAVDYAARRLLAPGAAVVPAAACVWAQLLELRLGPVEGLDLSAMDSYRWYPGAERVDLRRTPHRAVSAPFRARRLDLQARVAAVQAAWARRRQGGDAEDDDAGAVGGSNGELWEYDEEVEVPITAAGRWNAVAFWFDLQMAAPGNDADGADEARAWGAADVTSYAGAVAPDGAPPPESSSWGQAVQYMDGVDVAPGGAAQRVRVRQDAGQLVFASTPPPCRPRHALVPRWHYDMVLDSQRNAAYAAAIAAAVGRAKRGAAAGRGLLALDIGAGSGLLGMLAARAGADSVVGAEINGHMCDVGEECALANGFLGRVQLLDRDVRRMDTARKPDGTAPELPRRADLAVFEVFDSGLIGEGVLHLLAAARARLLAGDATLVPAGAAVFCQPVEMRVGRAAGVDVTQANRWRWRPDYEGVELAARREEWTPLAPPARVFDFDFYDAARNMAPAEARLDFTFAREGVFNAVVTWFELYLDEDTSLSTSPYADKGPTWQQAVQWVREVRVGGAGEAVAVTARHDTYAISYEVEAQHNGGDEAMQARYTDVPLQVTTAGNVRKAALACWLGGAGDGGPRCRRH
jgi:predicted RNA methylase